METFSSALGTDGATSPNISRSPAWVQEKCGSIDQLRGGRLPFRGLPTPGLAVFSWGPEMPVPLWLLLTHFLQQNSTRHGTADGNERWMILTSTRLVQAGTGNTALCQGISESPWPATPLLVQSDHCTWVVMDLDTQLSVLAFNCPLLCPSPLSSAASCSALQHPLLL